MTDVIFFNVWRTDSRAKQDELLASMRAEAGAFATRPGFRGLTAWRSEDGNRVIVEGRWESLAHFDAAVTNDPAAQATRTGFAAIAQPDPGIFDEVFRIEPAVVRIADVLVADGAGALREEAGNRWKQLGFETSMVSLPNVKLHVAMAGSGRPLVLLHGYPQSGEIWRYVAQELARSRRVIIPDLRGMGLSDIPPDGYDLPSVANDIHELLIALGIEEEVDIAGHDWGGAVAAIFALQFRSSIGRLAFIESAVAGAGFEDLWAFSKPNPALTFIPLLLADPLAENLISGREELFLHHLWNTFTYNKAGAPFADWQRYVDAMKRPGLVRSGASYYRSVYGAVGAIGNSIAAGKLSIPLLSVSGAASLGDLQVNLIQSFATNLTAHRTIANAGHFIAEEQPEALLSEFRWFFGVAK
jgi:pimeloyl-ACP methyl ester carboxylesterase/heme-degrading monooxygenase HmoA